MRKIYNRENLELLLTNVNTDLLFAIQNVEYRNEIKEVLRTSIEEKINYIDSRFDHKDCLELVNNFVYLHNEYYSINYDIWSDVKVRYNKNGEPYAWEYIPYAITFQVNKGNETYFFTRYGIRHNDFIEYDYRYIPRKPKFIA